MATINDTLCANHQGTEPSPVSLESGKGLPDLGFAVLDLVRAAFLRGDLVTTKSLVQQLLVGSPHLHAIFYLGAIAERSRDVELARRWYRSVLSIDPAHPGAVKRLEFIGNASGDVPSSTESRGDSQAPPAPTSFDQVSLAAGFYEALKSDQSTLSTNALAIIDETTRTVRPSRLAFPGAVIGGALMLLSGAVGIIVSLLIIPVLTLAASSGAVLAAQGAIFLCSLGMFCSGALTFLQLRVLRYEFREGMLKIRQGVFMTDTTAYELFRITRVAATRSVLQRLTGTGTIVLHVANFADGAPEVLNLPGVASAKELEWFQDRLRSLAQLLRQNPLIKGIIR